jgi:hypothetical protein
VGPRDEPWIRRVELFLRPVREDPTREALQRRIVEEASCELHGIEGNQFPGNRLLVQPAHFIRQPEHFQRQRRDLESRSNRVDRMMENAIRNTIVHSIRGKLGETKLSKYENFAGESQILTIL